MKEAFEPVSFSLGRRFFSVVYGAEEAAEETNVLMNYFLFFPRFFFYIFPRSPTHSRQLSEWPFLLAAILGHICNPLIPSNKERKGPFSQDDALRRPRIQSGGVLVGVFRRCESWQ